MGLVLAILGWGLLALLALVVGVLVLPWVIEGAGRTPPGPELRLIVRPLSPRAPAILRLRLTEFGGRRRKKKAPRRTPSRAARPARPAWQGRLAGRAVRALPDLVADTLAGIRVERLRLAGRLGLPDPAETGMLWGRLCPLLYAVPPGRLDLSLQPDFDRAVLQGEGEVALRLVPLRLAWPALRFLAREARPWSAT